MKYLGLMLMLLITSCSTNTFNLQGHPEWNWTDQAVFQQNMRICRYADNCNAEQLFIR